MHFGGESLSSLAPKTWYFVPDSFKNENSLLKRFKNRIKTWTTYKCPCRIFKIYIGQFSDEMLKFKTFSNHVLTSVLWEGCLIYFIEWHRYASKLDHYVLIVVKEGILTKNSASQRRIRSFRLSDALQQSSKQTKLHKGMHFWNFSKFSWL